jgi:hypothetical protein
MLKFGSADPPKLTKNTLESVVVDAFIKYLHQLIRADALDYFVIINLIDSETIRLLTYLFNPTETAREHPISHHWTVDWDVATIIQALEEVFPLPQEHQHLDRGSRWLQVVADSRARARIQAENMDQVRRDTINEWNSADANIGPFPYRQERKVLEDLARCFTNRSNPWHNDKPNVNFQRDLNLMIDGDREYLDNPTLSRLCAMVAELIHRWERLSYRMRGVNSRGSAPSSGKQPKSQKSNDLDRHLKDDGKTVDKRKCQGCNRGQHERDTCRLSDHPDFVKTGLWTGSATDRAIRVWERDESKIKLPWTRRADGTPLTTPLVWRQIVQPSIPLRADPPRCQ